MLSSKWQSTGGRGVRNELTFAMGTCSLGCIVVAASDKGIVAILLGDAPDALTRDLAARFPDAELANGDAATKALLARIVAFVDGAAGELKIPFDAKGTPFQKRVWQALCEIPPGTTISYGELAQRLGTPTATRAVATACAANPIAVAIPCHRVVAKNGALAGYRWGLERKRALLCREAEAIRHAR
jgi:AraC family transcriptional regulator, regulatory protein of adaptative response / methylated-DNA-[protein]-cysteine methyltransferase